MTGIRTLQRSDLAAMQAVWTQAGCEDLIPRVLHEKTFGALDYDPEFCIGYFAEEKLAGFACGTLLEYGNFAGIRLLLVDPARRKQGIGTTLLRELESRLQRSRAVSTISAMAVTGNYFTPGLDPLDMESTCFAEKHGYRCVNYGQTLIAELRHQREYRDRIEKLLKAGYQIVRAGAEHTDSLFGFLKEQFPHWVHEVRRSQLNDPPTAHLALWEGAVVAVGCAEGNNVGHGALGPLGIHPAHRGRGIGHTLMHRCVDNLRERGFQVCVLPWVSPDLSRSFKREFGARRTHVYWIYHKQIA